MSILLNNGSKLYNYQNKLLRTPITIRLNPVQMAYYSVAGVYSDTNTPYSGFVKEFGNATACWEAGAEMIQAYLTHNDARQMWRNSSLEPISAWYQGAYAPSASSLAASIEGVEAHINLGAYRFAIPEQLNALTVTKVDVSFVNGGGVQVYQSAGNCSTRNAALKGKFSFNTWNLPFLVSQNLDHPAQMGSNCAWDATVDILADAGEFRGVLDLWKFAGTTRDGAIATLTSPVTKTYTMRADTLAEVNEHRGCWIVPFFDAEYHGAQNYSPYYVQTAQTARGYWGCVSVWGLRMSVTLE